MAVAITSPIQQSNISERPGHFYRADIDGLRAVAIIVVVAFHVRFALFGGGFVGVDVFLVISGYLIGSLVFRSITLSTFSFLNFYVRRAKRILPALLTVIVACDVIAFTLLSPMELRDYCAQAFAAVTSTSNMYYWARSNYFNPVSALKPLLMTWSLGIEEQFYLLFPLGLFLLYKFAKKQVFGLVVVSSVASFVCCAACVNIYPSAAFYLLPMRAWELGLGVVIAIYEVQRNTPIRLGQNMANISGWAGLALIIVPIIAYTENTRFPGFAALLPTAGTACLIVANNGFINRKLLAAKPMVFVGAVSYSWYLWHWPLLSFARIVSGNSLSVLRASLIGLLSFLLAVASYYLIEQPFRTSLAPAKRLLPRYGVAVVLLGIPSLIGYLQSGWPERIPELVKAEAVVSAAERNPCLADFDQSVPRITAPCVHELAGPTMVLLGDSHAAALGPGVSELAAQHGYGFELLAKASCPPLSGVSLRWSLRPTFEQKCADFNRAVFQHVVADKKITVVLLAGFWSAPLADNSKQYYADVTQSGRAVLRSESYSNFHSGLLNAIVLLRSSGKRVLVATDVPRFDTDPMGIMRNSAIKQRGELAALLFGQVYSLRAIPKQELMKPPDRAADREVRQAALEGDAQIIDLSRNLCPALRCSFWNNGTLLYADAQHLTPAGAEYALQGQDPLANMN